MAQVSGYPLIGLLIDGEWAFDRPSCHEVRNPSTDEMLGTVPSATPDDIVRALQAARRGFVTWKNTPPDVRARVLRDAAAILRGRSEPIARLITLELGKPIADSRAEVERCCTLLEWDAAEVQRLYGRVHPSAAGMQQMVLRQPIGPVAAFTPWNAPLGSPTRKVSAALAAGCSLVLKPAEETPASACAFAQCLVDAGLPPGVLNVVFGNAAEISSTLISSSVVRMVTFTGSVTVGKRLTQLAAAEMKPVLMELGGHAPVLIADDVNPQHVARLAATAKVRMAGQICVSPTRFIVEERIYPDFVEAFASAMREVRVGDGFSSGVQMGPLANSRRLESIEALVADATRRGARVAAGGHRIGHRGCFHEPTVLADVPRDADAMFQEPFGPLALCVPVSDLDEGIALANSLTVGLAAYAFTNLLHKAERVARELECGILSINHFGGPTADMPFGGVKESGIGREGGMESLHAYTVSKMVSQRTEEL